MASMTGDNPSWFAGYLSETTAIIDEIDLAALDRVVAQLVALRSRGGRAFVLGCGGGAAHASHLVGDLRTLTGIEAYAAMDNVPGFTALVNDLGWDEATSAWLQQSHFAEEDLLFVFSVGGGDLSRNVSPNIVRAVDLAVRLGAPVVGVVGPDGGHIAQHGAAVVRIPARERLTPHVEGLQAVIAHGLVSHPLLSVSQPRWEELLSGPERPRTE